MKKLVTIIRVILFAALAGGLFWQHQTLQRLRAENAKLETAAAELDLLKEEAEQLRKSQADAGEMEKARQAKSELLRLRGEVSQSREQLKRERDARMAAEKKLAARATTRPAEEEVVSPVETFTANLRATLAPQQTLVTGGWKLPNGNRAIVMVEPSLVGSTGETFRGNAGEAVQVVIQTKFAEMSDEELTKAGLAGLRSEGKETAGQAILESEQSRLLTENLETTQGASVLSTPRVLTLDGRQAQVKTVNVRTIEGKEHELGPVLDVVPRVSADRQSIDMTIIAQIRQLANSGK